MSAYEDVLAEWKADLDSAVKDDEQLLEHLEFDPPCSIPGVTCEQPAAWYLKMRCCGAIVGAICAAHKQQLDAEFRLSDAIHFTWGCVACNERGRATEITEFLPIGRAK